MFHEKKKRKASVKDIQYFFFRTVVFLIFLIIRNSIRLSFGFFFQFRRQRNMFPRSFIRSSVYLHNILINIKY